MSWYRSEPVTIAALFLCPPLGVVLTWLYRAWDAVVKVAVSLIALCGFAVLVLALQNGGGQPGARAVAAPPVLAPAAVQVVSPAPNAQLTVSAASAAAQAGANRQQAAAALTAVANISAGTPAAIANQNRPAPAPTVAPVVPAPASIAPAPPIPAAAAQPAAAADAAAALPTQPAAEDQAASPAAAAGAAAAPAGGTLSANTKQTIAKILQGSIDNHREYLDLGKRALGTTRYANAAAVSTAQDQPSTPAAKFQAWRDQTNIDDEQTYQDAFNQAMDVYDGVRVTPNDALTDWLSDMSDVQQSLSDWADTAQDWEGREATDADLSAAEKKVRDLLAKAQADMQAALK